MGLGFETNPDETGVRAEVLNPSGETGSNEVSRLNFRKIRWSPTFDTEPVTTLTGADQCAASAASLASDNSKGLASKGGASNFLCAAMSE